MIIRNRCNYQNLSATKDSFYRKSEIEFLGREIDFSIMTPKQLNKSIAESITLYNKLYPPPEKKGFQKIMSKAIPALVVAGTVAVTGGAALGAYGVQLNTIMGAVSTGVSAVAPAASTAAAIQKGATAVSAAGILYGKVTGDMPEDLINASELIKSENALDAMEMIAKDQLAKQGMEIQAENREATDALRERLRKEQQSLSEKMILAADKKAAALGQQTPQKRKVSGMEIAAIATPFILYFMG